MFIRLDKSGISIHTTYNGFMGRGAVNNATNEEWLRIKREEAAVERRIEQIRGHEMVLRR